MARIVVGGLQHETNTFAPQPATFDAFLRPGGWPGLVEGAALPAAMAGINLPISGFIEAAEDLGHEIAPLLWAAATPSGCVTEDAFERLAAMLLARLGQAEPFAAVYLDLHGAMVCEHLDDGEAELLARVRCAIGDRLLVASLDLHANVSDAMVAAADLLIAYRTYPHIDLADTGRRAADRLDAWLDRPRPPAKAHIKPPFLIPIPWQCTEAEPACGLYAMLAALERETGAELSLCMGFPAADIPECGPSVLAYAGDPGVAQTVAQRLAGALDAAEPAFAGRLWAPDEAVAHAMRRVSGRPILLADTQDNPGAGGTSDTTGLLAALVAADAEEAVVALICDLEAAAAAHAAGEGARLELALGGRHGPQGVVPLRAEGAVERLSDGRFVATGPMFRGSPMDLGPMAVLRVLAGREGVRVVVSSRRVQVADRAILHHVGIEPAATRILAIKSSVHFRADFAPIAGEILIVAAPGLMPADPAQLPFRRLRPGVRRATRSASS
jgi:microcystin degradation protein MlrC